MQFSPSKLVNFGISSILKSKKKPPNLVKFWNQIFFVSKDADDDAHNKKIDYKGHNIDNFELESGIDVIFSRFSVGPSPILARTQFSKILILLHF